MGRAAGVDRAGVLRRLDGDASICPIDLTEVAALEKAFDAETGLSLGITAIVVTATVRDHGRVAGVPVDDTLSPPLTFEFSGEELNLVPSMSGGAPFPQLAVDRPGSVGRPGKAPASMSVLGHSVGVGAARRIGAAGVLVALVRRSLDGPGCSGAGG